ncbi:MAG: P1 family peptidase [Dehalococcoidia bacterium]
MNPTITAVAGLEAGHYTDRANATGCTVFLCREGAVGGVDVRGGSPGTRETDLLRPMNRVEGVHAVVLSGGSAFGLDAASGVLSYLAEQEIGLRVGPSIVPIVSSAILFDLNLISQVHPTAEHGALAARQANDAPMPEGTVGAGTGATVGKAQGLDRAVKGGIGSASLMLPDGSTVASAVAVNAYGGVFDYRSAKTLAGPRKAQGSGMWDTVELLLQGASGTDAPALSNTTIGVVATDAALTREEANYLARVSHNGLAMTIRPCHTMRDGDTMFALATGQADSTGDITILGAAAVEVTAQAVLRAIETATGLGGVPSVSELSLD